MGNCKDCKFWDRDWYDTRANAAECDAFGYIDYGQKLEDNDAMFNLSVSDDYGLKHQFMTGPMFGCVKFQPRG